MIYTKTNLDEIQNWLKLNLYEERYIHSIGTMECAVELAKLFNLDPEKAKTAGLLHDCAKCFSNEKLHQIITEHITWQYLTASVSIWSVKFFAP